MGGLVWVMVGLALWHFTVYLPDHFWAGIIGALVGACVGGFIGGLLLSGFDVPTNDEMGIETALLAIPGALAGLAVVYFIGLRQERLDEAARGGISPRR